MASALHDRFLAKSEEGKRFDLMQLVGKRFGFGDETQGMSWDETRTIKIISGPALVSRISITVT